jgi:hypothetical protein
LHTLRLYSTGFAVAEKHCNMRRYHLKSLAKSIGIIIVFIVATPVAMGAALILAVGGVTGTAYILDLLPTAYVDKWGGFIHWAKALFPKSSWKPAFAKP